jgi:ribonuclease Z
MPSVSFLGTGSGIPSSERYFSSFLLHLQGRHLLVDAGEPCVHSLRERGGLILEIDAILVTHGHVDHIGGLPALLQGAMLLGRSGPLMILLPKGMMDPVRAWIKALHLTEEGLGFPLTWIPWRDDVAVDLGEGVSVIPHANAHLEQSYRSLPAADPALPCESFSLEVTAGGLRALFSGDLSGAGELASLLARPADLLVCELSHFGAEDLARVLAECPLHVLCLVHLSEEYAGERASLQARFEELLPLTDDVFLPSDGEVIDF